MGIAKMLVAVLGLSAASSLVEQRAVFLVQSAVMVIYNDPVKALRAHKPAAMATHCSTTIHVETAALACPEQSRRG